jgi:hypothetical protein
VSLSEAFDGNQELYGEAGPKPPPFRRRTRKTPKILHPAGGELFGRNPGRSWASPRTFPPSFWGYLKSEKKKIFWRIFRKIFRLSKFKML